MIMIADLLINKKIYAIKRSMRRLYPLILAGVILITFFVSLKGGFVYDDHFQLENNPYIKDFSHLKLLITKDVWYFSPETKSNNYRPVHMLTYLFIYFVFGPNPLAYHAVNLMVHLIVVLLLYRVFLKYVEGLSAFLGALLFAVHPIHVESIAWIGGITDLLCAVFLLSSLLLFFNGKTYMSLIPFGFALWSKEIAVMFPALILADQWLFRRNSKDQTRRWFIGAILLIAIYSGMRIFALGTIVRRNAVSNNFFAQAYSAVVFAGMYIQKLLAPIQLNAFYDFHIPHGVTDSVPAIILLLIFVMLGWILRRNRILIFGLLWFIIFLLPALVVSGVSPVLFAERYLYLPSAGAALAAVSFRMRSRTMLLMFVLVIVYAIVSFNRSRIWHDDLALWADTIQKSPGSATVNYNLATAYMKTNR
ncbi:MAG: hypothetical protein C5B54_05235, partial [Acidobacteria bacterium]